jgi:hypothetical protein
MVPDSLPDRLHRKLRRWKALALFLLGGVAILSGLCGFLLWSADAENTRLVDRIVPAFDELRHMSTTALSVQRSLLSSWVTTEADLRQRAIAQARTRIGTGYRQLGRLDSLTLFRESPAMSERLKRTGKAYFTSANQLVGLLAASRWEQAVVLRHEVVKPALDEYLDAIERAAGFAESASVGRREIAGGEAGSRTALVVGLNRGPVLGFTILALTVGLMLIGLLFFLDGREHAGGS